MSEEEMLKNIRKQIENTIKANECGLSNNDFKEDIEALELLHDRYLKEKEKNKELDKIKFIITDKLPPDMKYVCYCNTDFERLFSNDFISKDKIREFKNKFIKDSKNEKVFMTQSSQINASLIQFCNELLEERN